VGELPEGATLMRMSEGGLELVVRAHGYILQGTGQLIREQAMRICAR